MGFLDSIFGGDKPTPQNIQKLVVRVKERYAQPEYRREAMDTLLNWSTPESLLAVCQRFTVVAQSPHWDEEEKRWLVDELAERGAEARSALLLFVQREDNVAFAVKALRAIVGADEFVTDLVLALAGRSPVDHRNVQGKQELVAALGETADARAFTAILPHLSDHSDDVQCCAVDALVKLWPQAAAAHDQGIAGLLVMITDDARSARVQRHAAGAVEKLGLPIDAARALAPSVAEDFVVKAGKLAHAHAG